jgi:hypothetical protein
MLLSLSQGLLREAARLTNPNITTLIADTRPKPMKSHAIQKEVPYVLHHHRSRLPERNTLINFEEHEVTKMHYRLIYTLQTPASTKVSKHTKRAVTVI